MRTKRRSWRRENTARITLGILGGAAAVGAALFIIKSVPEMVRYLRIKRM